MPIRSKVEAVDYILWRSPNGKWHIAVRDDRSRNKWSLRVVSYGHVDYPLSTTCGVTYQEPGRVPEYVKVRVNLYFLSLGKYGEIRDLRMLAIDRVEHWMEVWASSES